MIYETYVINFDDPKSIGAHWLTLCVNVYHFHNGNFSNVTCFDSFVGENILAEILKFVSNKNYRIETYDSIICG